MLWLRKFFKIAKVICVGLYYSLKILLIPKDIGSILKLGNLLTDTRGFDHSLERAKADVGAAALIRERYTEGGIDLEKIQFAPEGTLGAAVVEHMRKFNLDAYGLVMAPNVSERIYLRERQREIHDILHCVFNLGIDIKDEAKLNAIVMGQIYSPIATLIVAGSMIHTLFKEPTALPDLVQAILEGVQIGQNSASVFSVRWEEFMFQPIGIARDQLKVRAVVRAITKI